MKNLIKLITFTISAIVIALTLLSPVQAKNMKSNGVSSSQYTLTGKHGGKHHSKGHWKKHKWGHHRSYWKAKYHYGKCYWYKKKYHQTGYFHWLKKYHYCRKYSY